MKIKVLGVFLLFAMISSAHGQGAVADLSNYGVRIEPDRRLLVVLATLEMATVKNADGVEERLIKTPLSEKGRRFRDQLAVENASLPEDLRRRISVFVANHKKRNPKASDSELVTPFMSMAYSLSPAPELADPVVMNDLPGSLLDVLDFAPLVREFYRRSTISSKLDGYIRDYRGDADGTLRSSSREMVGDILDYLHTRPILTIAEKVKTETQRSKTKREVIQKVETRTHERRFNIVPERLAPSDTVTFLNIRDDYFVIVPPDADILFSEARRAFIQFIIDPLILSNSKEVAPMRDFVRSAIEEQRKARPGLSPDPFLAISRSLVAAIDVRQAEYQQVAIATSQARARIASLKTDDEKRSVSAELEKFKQSLSDDSALRLYADYEKGSVLSFYFAEQLKGIEDSGFDIGASLREMIASFDAAREPARIAATADARRRALAAREDRKKHPETRTVAVVENPVTTRLLAIQKSIDEKNLAKAAADLKLLSQQHPDDVRVYYNLGRVASLSAEAVTDPDEQAKKLHEAKNAYSMVVAKKTDATDRALLSLTFVALGRIYEFMDDPAYALKLYDEAVKLTDVPGGAFQAALAAKQRLLKSQ
jgi:hypothetical protein